MPYSGNKMNKDFSLYKKIQVIKDYDSNLKKGSTGVITAFLDPEEFPDDLVSVFWEHRHKENDAPQVGPLTTYRDFSWALNFLKEHCVVLDVDRGYKKYIEEVGELLSTLDEEE